MDECKSVSLTPLILAAAVIAPPVMGSVRVADLLVVGLLPALLRAWWMRHRTITLSLPERCFLLFVGWSAIATVVGLATGTAGRGLWAALTMARLLELTAVYAAARIWPAERRRLALTATLLGVIMASWGSWEIFAGVVIHGEPYVRAFNEGWFRGESTHVAGALVLLGLASLSREPGASGRGRMTGSLASLVGVLVSGSRGALAASVMTVTRYLWLIGRRPAVVMVIAAVGLAALAAPAAFRNRAIHVLDQGSYSGPHVDRFTAWSVAVAEAPAWGVGLGARPSSVYESNYVWMYAETGLPGLVLGTLFLLSLLRLPDSGEDEEAWRMRSGIGLALLVLSFGANVFLISRIAIPAALLLAFSAPRREAVAPTIP